MYTQHLSSLQFLTLRGFFAVVVVAARASPAREASRRCGRSPTPKRSWGARPAAAEVLPRRRRLSSSSAASTWWRRTSRGRPTGSPVAGYAGHLVRDLSNTHVMIVGGGTLISTGPLLVRPPANRRAPARQRRGLPRRVLVHGGRASRLLHRARRERHRDGPAVAHGWEYEAAKEHMGKLYRVPVGMGAGVMGLGYWCFAANVILTVVPGASRPRVPKPIGHLWKFLAAGAAGLTVGTVQGVIQVQPAHADWLYEAGHAGEWIDPISHAHINLVTGLTMLTAGVALLPPAAARRRAASRRVANACFAVAPRRVARLLRCRALPRLPRGPARRRSAA